MRPFHQRYFKQKRRCHYNFTKGKRKGQLCNIIVDNENFCSKHINIQTKNNSNIIKVRYHQTLGLIYDPETNLVFKSDIDKLVIGSIVLDQFSSDYDVNLCDRLGLKHCKDIPDENYIEKWMKNGLPTFEFSQKDFYQEVIEYFL
jgi:hypothetical protein